MPNHRISAVIFDLGRVLVNIDFEAFPNALGLTTPESRAPYAGQAALLARLYETGRLSTDEFIERLFVLFNRRFERGHLLFAWNEIIREDVPGMADLVGRVQKHARTAMLSNTSQAHFEKAERTSRSVQLIAHRFLSYEVGVMKPERGIYEAVTRGLALPASELLFIDDLKENIDGAREAGMHGILFSDLSRLESELSLLGVLPPSVP
ncbi:MAG: HAD family hydrolase [Acidobacteriota bacterium]